MKFFIDEVNESLNHFGEELCGDKVEVVRQDNRFVMVLADGLGSGVKANILSTLTSKIIATMLSEGASLDDAVSTISATLPVCNERNLAYSTFTIIKVEENGETSIIEFDNPLALVYRDNKPMYVDREEIDVFGKRIYVSSFEAQANDKVVMFSDGVVHAGVGSLLDLGWMYDNVVKYVDDIIAKNQSIRSVLRDILNNVSAFYLEKPGDDSTVAVLEFKRSVKGMVMVGPPTKAELDKEVVGKLMNCDGYKIVCGGTTSQIVARTIGKEVEVSINYDSPSLPPTAVIDGIDLVTEGVLTLGKAVQLLQEMNDDNPEMRLRSLDIRKSDGASKLAKLLSEECTDISFMVGRAINPAHQNPDLPISLNLKLQLVRECAAQLEKMGKRVSITYY